MLSIANRISGLILSLGAVGLLIWLSAAAAGPGTYGVVQSAIGSWAGQIVLFGCTFAFFLHLSSSCLGHGPRFRASVDLHFGMDGLRIERGVHRGGMGGQSVCRGVAPMSRRSFRSPLARALGLGSAKSGVQHWWTERITAVALVPLCLWFVVSVIAHVGNDYAVFIAWIGDTACHELHDPLTDRAISSLGTGSAGGD